MSLSDAAVKIGLVEMLLHRNKEEEALNVSSY
jgi:hypothetical protein